MNPPDFAGITIALGAAAGAALGAVLLSSPVANADDFLPKPPFPGPVGDFSVLGPPGAQSLPTNIEKTTLPGYSSVTEDYHYTLPREVPPPVDPTGSYDTTYRDQIFGGVPLIYSDATEKVTDSTGAAPAVGTDWDGTALQVNIPPVGTGQVFPGFSTDIFTNDTMTVPTGGVADDFMFLPTDIPIANQFYVGPAGVFDYLVDVESGPGPHNPVPIIDIPFTTSSTAATDAGALF